MKKTMKPLAPLFALLALSACGPQAYVPGVVQSDQNAPGGMNVPPKVDILLGMDMKGAMKDIYPGLINRDIPEFVAKLEASGWDYRIKAISLSESEPGSAYPVAPVAVSKFHGNWSSYGSWISPFPGAQPSDPTLNIPSSLFSALGSSNFFPSSISNNPNDGKKPGLQNQADFLGRADVQSDFLRRDALLAVITMSISKDTSGGSWVTSPVNPLNTYWQAGANDAAYLVGLQNQIINAKSGAQSLVKVYPLVSQYDRSNMSCRGTNADSGIRYINFANSMNGYAWNNKFDLCSNTPAQALDAVTASLKSERMNFRKDKLIINTEPNNETLAVYKFSGGRAESRAQLTRNQNCNPNAPDSVKEFKYLGYVPADSNNPIYTIDAPVPMGAVTTGSYVVQLCGGARLIGEDSARVEYMNNGAVVAY